MNTIPIPEDALTEEGARILVSWVHEQAGKGRE